MITEPTRITPVSQTMHLCITNYPCNDNLLVAVLVWVSCAELGINVSGYPKKQTLSQPLFRHHIVKFNIVKFKLNKANDTSDHKILLQKLVHYYIDQNSSTWFRSYLSDRTQRCHVNGHLSSDQSIKFWVPQGNHRPITIFGL